ncbi:MAG: hypothetical protein ACJ71D_00250 [Nitrososphaera sp.]
MTTNNKKRVKKTEEEENNNDRNDIFKAQRERLKETDPILWAISEGVKNLPPIEFPFKATDFFLILTIVKKEKKEKKSQKVKLMRGGTLNFSIEE